MKKWRAWLRGSDQPAPFEIPINLASAAFFADPAPTYAWLHENHPVAPVQQGGFVLTQHADITAALSNPAFGNAPSRFSVLNGRNAGKYAAAAMAAHIPPFLDAPDHVPVRKALSAAFYSALDASQDWIGDTATDHVARQTGKDVDLISDIARPFACNVMARFVGLPLDPAQIKSATQSFFHVFAPITDQAEFAEANVSIANARQLIIANMPASPAQSLIGALRNTQLNDDQIADNAYLILADGVENIEAAIAMSFDILSRQDLDLNDDETLHTAILECLRLSSPAQLIPRVLREDIQLMGAMRPAGVPVFLALGAANLDPSAYVDPQTFRLDRDTAPLLAFGQGRHSCIGQQLAILQIKPLVRALFTARAQVIKGGHQNWVHRFGHRWPARFAIHLPNAT